MAKSIYVLMLILALHVIESAMANKLSSLSHADECSLLFRFKESMSIDNSSSSDSHAYPKVASWYLNRTDGKRNCCLWDGVECRLGHVIGLDLSSSFLSGPISSNNSLFNLIHLQSLNLADNNFISSKIPSGIGRLSQLANLNLSWSSFSGEVPKQISQLRNLVSLDLSGNLLNLQSSDFKNLVQNSSETLRELLLSGVNIDSGIPDSIGNLTHLNILDLSWCAFRGTLPASVSRLTQLRVLDLSVNYFVGPIPPLVSLSNLKYLKLSDLDLKSTNQACEIMSAIGNMTQLRQLYLIRNGLVGQIPSTLVNLTHLTTLDLSSNEFTGSLPSLEGFSNLTHLSLFGNSFDRWKLPDWFGKLKKITHLDLEYVNLYGEIPSSLYNLTQVKELHLSSNHLKGPLTKSLLNFQDIKLFYLDGNNVTVDLYLFLSLKKLKYLDLSGNNITLSDTDSHKNETQPQFKILGFTSCNLKVFPEFLRFQHQLEYLNLDNNNIEVLIPGWMWNISKETLSGLSLASNLLTGEIQTSACDLLYLRLLDLSFNNITGSIPPCFVKLSNSLEVLNLRRNNLQGTIPNIFTNESKLQMINLSQNKLEGQLPRSLENCELLQVLDLGYNFIEDTFPFWLGALSNLRVLITRFNKFYGTIRIPTKMKVNFPKLSIIDISYNSFSGSLPHQYFQEWSSMKETKGIATFIETYMWGAYWFSIQMTNKGINTDYERVIKTFVAVDLSSNMFTGEIPESIKSLTGLKLFNLSNNEISGIIPPSMGNLIHLEALDLSNNKLSGMIPQDLAQLNFLEVLNVSNNKLTGPIPQGTQLNTFSNDSYMGNQALCGYPLSVKCGDSKTSMPPKLVSLKEDTDFDFPNGIDWVVILIGVASGLVIGLVCGDYLTTRFYTWFLIRFRKRRW